MTVSVHELELPELDTTDMDRDEALVAIGEARKQSWLARTPLGFTVTTYEDTVGILRERRFHSALSFLPRAAGMESSGYFRRRRRSILTMEGAEHTRLRRLVTPAFTPSAIDKLRPVMREVISGLLDDVCQEDEFDVVSEVCEPFPIPVICELIGAPKEDWKLFSEWATDIFRIFNRDLENDLPAIERASLELESYVRQMIDERRKAPREDLLSRLIEIEETGDRLSTDELTMMTEAILMAGTDTTRNQLACCMALFAVHPQEWQKLVEDPSLAPKAVEESMRYLGAVRGTARVAAEDVSYRGVLFPAGTLVSVSLSGANHDPAVFEMADVLDISQDRSLGQLTFGSGIHHCLGASLARAELQEALEVLSRRIPSFSLGAPVEWKPASFGIWGPSRLSICLAPESLSSA